SPRREAVAEIAIDVERGLEVVDGLLIPRAAAGHLAQTVEHVRLKTRVAERARDLEGLLVGRAGVGVATDRVLHVADADEQLRALAPARIVVGAQRQPLPRGLLRLVEQALCQEELTSQLLQHRAQSVGPLERTKSLLHPGHEALGERAATDLEVEAKEPQPRLRPAIGIPQELGRAKQLPHVGALGPPSSPRAQDELALRQRIESTGVVQ